MRLKQPDDFKGKHLLLGPERFSLFFSNRPIVNELLVQNPTAMQLDSVTKRCPKSPAGNLHLMQTQSGFYAPSPKLN
jgi:hypothetical protein